MRMRSRTCEQVLGWYCTGNSCRKCAKLVGKFNNESEDDVINLSKVDGEDLHKIFNSIFPGAFNMKTITDDKTINKSLTLVHMFYFSSSFHVYFHLPLLLLLQVEGEQEFFFF
jgi:hypothetical protein